MIKILGAFGLSILMLAGEAHAGITQPPALPAQLSLDWAFDIDPATGRPSTELVAAGPAAVVDERWTAPIASVSNGLIHLDASAGISFRPLVPDFPIRVSLPVWKDITIDYVKQRVTADAYMVGIKMTDDQVLFFTGGGDFGTDPYPQGKSTLWINEPAACQLVKPSCSSVTLWAPTQAGTLTISSVPEPNALAAAMVGLVGVAWRVRRRCQPASQRS